MSNVLLTSSSGLYFSEREMIFFNSLRKHYDGEVYVFTNNNPTEEFIKYANKYSFFIIPYPCKIHHCVDRNFYFKKFLEQKPNYEKIFISDCGDVIWQGNPFEFDCSIEFASEGVMFSQCKCNTDWMILKYGEDIANEFKFRQVSCAGTIRGNYEEIYDYLVFQYDSLINTTGNLDQATHNFYLYEVKKDYKIKNIEDGNIFTAGQVHKFVFNSEGLLINNQGIPYCCVHQYVHRKILDIISKQYC